MGLVCEADYPAVEGEDDAQSVAPEKIPSKIKTLTAEMKKSADDLEFEKAAHLKKRIKTLKEMEAKYIADMKK